MKMLLFARNAGVPHDGVELRRATLEKSDSFGDSHCRERGEPHQNVPKNDSCDGKEQKKQSRRVRFADDNNDEQVKVEVMGPLLKPSSEMIIEEKQLHYLHKSELELFRTTARVFAKEARKRDLKDPRPHSYSRVLLRVYDDCHEDYDKSFFSDSSDEEERMDSDMVNLKRWVSHGHCRRGLERWVVPEMTVRKRDQIDSVVSTVLQAQKRLEKNDCLSTDAKADCLRHVSERYSRPAKVFAHKMAEADEAAARRENTTPELRTPDIRHAAI